MGRVTGPLIDRMLRRTFESMLASVEEAALNVGPHGGGAPGGAPPAAG